MYNAKQNDAQKDESGKQRTNGLGGDVNRILIIVFFLGVTLVSQLSSQEKGPGMVWPLPPDKPRIQYLQTISSLEKFQPKKGFFAKLFSLITGGDRPTPWLVQPVGIAVAPDGRIIIADPGANCLHVLNLKEGEYDAITETKYGKFISPVGLTFANDGTLYVSDSKRGDIIYFDHDLNARGEFKDSLHRPTGILVNRDTLYVVDVGGHDIVMFDRSGKFLGLFGHRGTGDGEFNYPVQLAANNSLYVVDGLNYRIQKFDFGWKHLLTFGSQGTVAGKFSSPKGIALDSDNDIYVTDALMDNFQIFNPEGQLLLVVGRKGSGDGEFMSPGGIAVDPSDKIFIVETLNKRIQIFQYLK